MSDGIKVKEVSGMGLCAVAKKAFEIGDIVLSEKPLLKWGMKCKVPLVLAKKHFNAGEKDIMAPHLSTIIFVYKVCFL